MEKAKLAREAAERERQRRKKENTVNQTKNSFVDMDGEVQEGVMDNLLVALKTGKAFEGKNRRRRVQGTPNSDRSGGGNLSESSLSLPRDLLVT